MKNQIHWLIQSTSSKITSEKLEQFILENKAPFTGFGVIPFTNTITNLSHAYRAYLNNPDITFVARGGTKILDTLISPQIVKSNLIRELQFDSISYDQDSLDVFISKVNSSVFYNQEYFTQKYQNTLNLPLLNSDAQFYKINDVLNLSFPDEKFVKPNGDGKQFSAGILHPGQTVKEFIEGGYFRADYRDSEILVSSPKNIFKEYRFIVLNGEIIAGSQYSQNHKFQKEQIDIHENSDLINSANNFASQFSPSIVFTLDVCETKDHEFKIVEYNCFNCSGLYFCDSENIFNKLNSFFGNMEPRPKP